MQSALRLLLTTRPALAKHNVIFGVKFIQSHPNLRQFSHIEVSLRRFCTATKDTKAAGSDTHTAALASGASDKQSINSVYDAEAIYKRLERDLMKRTRIR